MEDHPSALLRLLPPEILFAVLVQLEDPIELAAFSQTCKAAHAYCEGNSLLWRETFLRHFDPPSPSAPRIDFERRLKDRIRARQIIRAISHDRQTPSAIRDHEAALIPIFNSIAREAISPASPNITFLLSLFPPNSMHTSNYLASAAQSTSVTEQDISEFRTRHGPTPRTFVAPNITRSIRSVYTLSNYTAKGHYGPYLSDGSGRANWTLAEQLRTVMQDNLRDARESEAWGETDDGRKVVIPGDMGWEDTARINVGADDRDWAGVETGFEGSYVFLDAPVFELVNARNPPTIPASHLRRQGVGECQRIALTLDSPTCPSTETYPRLNFTGVLAARDAAPSPDHPSLAIKGFVEPVPEGGVRWQFNVIYAGATQWVLEGFEVAPRSRLGMQGVWFGAEVGGGRDGPCGPFAFWRPAESEM